MSSMNLNFLHLLIFLFDCHDLPAKNQLLLLSVSFFESRTRVQKGSVDKGVNLCLRTYCEIMLPPLYLFVQLMLLF